MYWVRPDVALALDIGVTDLTVESTPTTDRTSGTFAFLAGARYYPPLSGYSFVPTRPRRSVRSTNSTSWTG